MPSSIKPEEILGVATRMDFGMKAPEGATLWEQLWAAESIDNVIVSVGRAATRLSTEPKETPPPEFNVLDSLTPAEQLNASDYALVKSEKELAEKRLRISRELELRQQLGNGPLPTLVASSIAVLTDPTSYIPIAGAVGKGGRLAKMARVGAISAAEIAAQEAALRATQETRTIEESLTAVLLGGAFGMGLGAIVAGRGGARVAGAVDKPSAARAVVQDALEPLRMAEPKAAGAAPTPPKLTPEDTELAPAMGAVTVIKNTLAKVGLAPASFHLMTSRFHSARLAAMELVDVGMTTKGMLKGREPPRAAEINIEAHQTAIVRANQAIDLAYLEHRQAGGRMSRGDFEDSIWLAWSRGDKFDDPHVQKAANELRPVLTQYADAARAVNILEETTVKTGKGYAPRFLNQDLVKADLAKFKEIVLEDLKTKNPKEDTVILRDMAQRIINTVLSAPNGFIPPNLKLKGPGPRGSLKEKTWDIADEKIEKYVVKNAKAVMARYIRTMAADIEMAKQFGVVDPTETLTARIHDEAVAMAEKAKTPKESKQILDESKTMIDVVGRMVARVRGTNMPVTPIFRNLSSAARSARNLAFSIRLGGVSLASIPDAGSIVMKEGLARTMAPVFADMLRGFKAIKMSKREAQELGAALDAFNNDTSLKRFGIESRNEFQTGWEKVEQVTQGIASIAAKLFLINPWNGAMKSVVTMVHGTRTLRTAQKIARGEKLTKFETLNLARTGLSQEDAMRIADQAEYWEVLGSGVSQTILPNTHLWKNQAAVEAYRQATLRRTRDLIITPGAGDTPQWTQTTVGQSIFQFKNFSAASTTRLLVSGLQARDMAAMNGALLMVGLGAMSVILRDIATNGEVKDRTPEQFIADAIDRSGLASMFFEFNSLMDKGLGISPVSLATGAEPSRFAGRGLLEQLAGPTAGMVTDAAAVAAGLINGDVTQSDLNKLRRFIPLNNAFYLGWAFTKIEQGIADAFGLPEKQSRPRPLAAGLPNQ